MAGDEVCDATLLQQWRSGDKSAANVLVARHFKTLYRFFSGRSPEVTADLVQRTFLACVESKDRVPDDVAFRVYLLGIARNVLLMTHRKAYRQAKVIEPGHVSMAAPDRSPSQALAVHREQQVLLRSLRKLPVEMQLSLQLFYWEGLSREEIARVLGVEMNTVKSRLQRAKQKLRALVEELDPETATQTLHDFDRWVSSLRDVTDDGS